MFQLILVTPFKKQTKKNLEPITNGTSKTETGSFVFNNLHLQLSSFLNDNQTKIYYKVF